MSYEQARALTEQATQALQRGQHSQAVQLADQAISLDPTDADSHILKGIALSQLRDGNGAVDAFRQAISLNPHNGKAFYNLAVHYYSAGEMPRALEMAREAVRVEPSHAQARELAGRIEQETGSAADRELPSAPPGQSISAPAAPMQPGAYYRGEVYGYEQPLHSIRMIESLGRVWDGIGIGLIVVGAAFFTYNIVTGLHTYGQIVGNLGQYMNSQENFGVAMFTGAVGLVIRLVNLIWLLMDLLDRRNTMLWLLPSLIACCCGLEWVVSLIYYFGGRNK
jgi:tetratricopeptide (TPR) repeat protein